MQGREVTGTSRDRADWEELSEDLNAAHSWTFAMLLLVLVIHKRDPDFRLIDQGVFHGEYRSTAIFNLGLFVCLMNVNHCYEA